jgi:hypothetical protein
VYNDYHEPAMAYSPAARWGSDSENEFNEQLNTYSEVQPVFNADPLAMALFGDEPVTMPAAPVLNTTTALPKETVVAPKQATKQDDNFDDEFEFDDTQLDFEKLERMENNRLNALKTFETKQRERKEALALENIQEQELIQRQMEEKDQQERVQKLLNDSDLLMFGDE